MGGVFLILIIPSSQVSKGVRSDHIIEQTFYPGGSLAFVLPNQSIDLLPIGLLINISDCNY